MWCPSWLRVRQVQIGVLLQQTSLHGAWDAGHKEDCLGITGIVTHRAARVASTAAGLKSVAGASTADSTGTVEGARAASVTQAQANTNRDTAVTVTFSFCHGSSTTVLHPQALQH